MREFTTYKFVVVPIDDKDVYIKEFHSLLLEAENEGFFTYRESFTFSDRYSQEYIVQMMYKESIRSRGATIECSNQPNEKIW